MEKTMTITFRSLIVLLAFLWIFSSLGEAATTQVDCSSATLQAAIEKAKPGDTLLVSGACKENVVIYEEVARITLDGQGKATIEGADTSKHTVQVRGRGITIKGFTITGGRGGLIVTRGGQADIDGNTVQGAARSGIVVTRHSSANIANNTVQNNGRHGIVANGSSARIGNNTVKNNGRYGIVINDTSAVLVGLISVGDRTASPNIIENNERSGILVGYSSSARIVGNTIRNNKRAGIRVSRSSSLISSNTINGNGRNGIMIQNSNVSLGRRRGSRIIALSNSTTSKNSGAGVWCSGNSSVSGRLGSLNGEEGVKHIDPSCVGSLKQ